MGKLFVFPKAVAERKQQERLQRIKNTILKVNELIAEMKEIEGSVKNTSSSDEVIPKRETNKGRDV